jgi:hypothetical protein
MAAGPSKSSKSCIILIVVKVHLHSIAAVVLFSGAGVDESKNVQHTSLVISLQLSFSA